MSKAKRALVVLVAAASLSAAGTGFAQPQHPHPGEPGSVSPPREPVGFVAQLPQRRSLSLAEAITIAQSRHPGRVVRAQTIEMGNGAVHEVRIIGNDGRVHTVRVDARTGSVQ